MPGETDPSPAPRPPDSPSAAGFLSHDLACLRCDYNLRGLSPTGDCPECGFAIPRTRADDGLRIADPAWLRRLSTGAMLIGVTLLLILINAPIGVRLMGRVTSVDLDTTMCIEWALPLSLLFPVGVWLFTTPQPGGSLRSLDDQCRCSARALLPFAYACSVMAVLLELTTPGPTEAELARSLHVLSDAVEGCGWMALLAWANRLATRADHRVFAPRSGMLLGVVFVYGGAVWFGVYSPTSLDTRGLASFPALAAIFLWITAIGYAISVHGALRNVADQAAKRSLPQATPYT